MNARTEAESSVLGACILSAEALTKVVGALHHDDFEDTSHRVLFDVLLEMYTSGKPIDIMTLSQELQRLQLFERIGGNTFLTNIIMNVGTTSNAEYYATLVKDYSRRDKLRAAAKKIAEISADYGITTDEAIADAEKLIYETNGNSNVIVFQELSKVAGAVVEEALSPNKKDEAFFTSFTDLDAITGGFKAGSLIIVAARPSMGKTALVTNMLQYGYNSAKPQAPKLMFSLEMSAKQIAERVVASESKIALRDLKGAKLYGANRAKLERIQDSVKSMNLYIADTPKLTETDVKAKCRNFAMRHGGVSVVAIDYLQLMNTETPSLNRTLEIAMITRTLKLLARELECPVIVLSQLSRENEKRTDKRPLLSDMRDSGAIEQDADVVLTLYREDYYTLGESSDLMNSKSEIHVAKNRSGKTGACSLMFDRELTRYYNYEKI